MHTGRLKLLLVGTTASVVPSLAIAQENVGAEIGPLSKVVHDDLHANGISDLCAHGLSVESILDADIDGPTGGDIGEVEKILRSDEDPRHHQPGHRPSGPASSAMPRRPLGSSTASPTAARS